MATVHVRFFARYAELTGTESTAVTVPGDATISDVLLRVRDTLPGAATLPARPLVALNLRQVQLTAAVRDGDEVAFLPPLAGG
jgi:molybdopterin converting factor small subunit